MLINIFEIVSFAKIARKFLNLHSAALLVVWACSWKLKLSLMPVLASKNMVKNAGNNLNHVSIFQCCDSRGVLWAVSGLTLALESAMFKQ